MSFQPIQDRKRRRDLGFPGPVNGSANRSLLSVPDLFPGFEKLNTGSEGQIKPPASGKDSDPANPKRTVDALGANEAPTGAFSAIDNPSMNRQVVLPRQHKKDDSLGDPERRPDAGTSGDSSAGGSKPSGNSSSGFALGRGPIMAGLLLLGAGFLVLQFKRG